MGKIAIVTGGASGIGRSLCESLGELGAVVVVTDINGAGAEKVATAIVGSGGKAESFTVDVTIPQQVQQVVDDVVRRYGRLDYMFNNAGIDIGGELRDLSLDQIRRVIDINLWGVIYGTHSAYRVMVKQGFGHIINTASMVGLIPLPMEPAYVTAKHAVVGLSTSLRVEAAALGVRVSVVCPDFIKSNFYLSSKHVNVDEKKLIDEIPDFVYISPKRCARKILRGTAHNKGIITVGLFVKLLWRTYRLSPRLFMLGQRLYAARLRRLRLEGNS